MGTGQAIQERLDELMQQSNSQPATENFDHITLTEDEIKEGLLLARERKHYRLKQEEYKQRLMQAKKYPTYTASQVFDYFSMQCDVDDENVTIVQELCKYFTGDKSFNGDLNKGLMLMGGVGVGKTTMMKFFMRNQILSYRILSCREVESKFSENGEQFIYNCSFLTPIASNSDMFGHKEIGTCFDDLGTESNAKYFGKEKNVMAEIILNRYDNKIPFTATHITTNLTASSIKEIYGSRVTDRFREMFNLIQFKTDAKSRRN